jgi:hypothetical protein
MQKALVIIVLAILALPATASASEAQLHGGWNLAAVSFSGQRMDVPPELNLHVTFDKTKKSWTFKTDYSETPTEVTGQYRLAGDQLTVSMQGQEAPPITIAFIKGELHIQIALDQSAGADKYTFIAKRGSFKAKPKPPKAKPAPPPPSKPTPRPAKPKTPATRDSW